MCYPKHKKIIRITCKVSTHCDHWYAQKSHLYGFSLLCILPCYFKKLTNEFNYMSQIHQHICKLSHVKLLPNVDSGMLTSHIVHILYGFSLLCILTCYFKKSIDKINYNSKIHQHNCMLSHVKLLPIVNSGMSHIVHILYGFSLLCILPC